MPSAPCEKRGILSFPGLQLIRCHVSRQASRNTGVEMHFESFFQFLLWYWFLLWFYLPCILQRAFDNNLLCGGGCELVKLRRSWRRWMMKLKCKVVLNIYIVVIAYPRLPVRSPLRVKQMQRHRLYCQEQSVTLIWTRGKFMQGLTWSTQPLLFKLIELHICLKLTSTTLLYWRPPKGRYDRLSMVSVKVGVSFETADVCVAEVGSWRGVELHTHGSTRAT